MMDLFVPGGHLHPAAAVHDFGLRPQPQRGTGGVHGHVAAADGDHFLAADGCRAVLGKTEGFHQVGAGEILVGGVDADQVLTGDFHELGQSGPRADEHHVVIGKQLLDADSHPDDHVQTKLHAQGLQVVDLGQDHLLGQAELRDTVHQHATGQVQRLENSYLVAQLDQVPGHGQPGGTGAHHRHLLPGVRCHLRDLDLAGVALVIGGEPLQTADTHRVPFLGQHALDLALGLLGAHPAGHGRQRVFFSQLPGRLHKLAFFDQLDKTGNVDTHRAARDTHRFLASQAPLRFLDGGLFTEAVGDLIVVVDPHRRVLLRHLLSRNGHSFFRIHSSALLLEVQNTAGAVLAAACLPLLRCRYRAAVEAPTAMLPPLPWRMRHAAA